MKLFTEILEELEPELHSDDPQECIDALEWLLEVYQDQSVHRDREGQVASLDELIDYFSKRIDDDETFELSDILSHYIEELKKEKALYIT